VKRGRSGDYQYRYAFQAFGLTAPYQNRSSGRDRKVRKDSKEDVEGQFRHFRPPSLKLGGLISSIKELTSVV
jgi:hypothetical protein